MRQTFLSLLLALSTGCQCLTVKKGDERKKSQAQKAAKEGRFPSSVRSFIELGYQDQNGNLIIHFNKDLHRNFGIHGLFYGNHEKLYQLISRF